MMDVMDVTIANSIGPATAGARHASTDSESETDGGANGNGRAAMRTRYFDEGCEQSWSMLLES